MNNSIRIDHRQNVKGKFIPASIHNYNRASDKGLPETNNCNISSQINEPTVSQGCCLAVIKIVFFAVFYLFPTRTQGMRLPNYDFPAI
jgi:hypothetical protein